MTNQEDQVLTKILTEIPFMSKITGKYIPQSIKVEKIPAGFLYTAVDKYVLPLAGIKTNGKHILKDYISHKYTRFDHEQYGRLSKSRILFKVQTVEELDRLIALIRLMRNDLLLLQTRFAASDEEGEWVYAGFSE